MLTNHETTTTTTTVCFFFLLILISPLAGAQSTNTDVSSKDAFLVIIILLIMGGLVAMCICCLCICQCFSSPSGRTRNRPGATGRTHNRPDATDIELAGLPGATDIELGGLVAAVIDTFPTLEYSAAKEHKIGKGALECGVCLIEFKDPETLRLLPKCDHVFHRECIDKWLSSSTTCPVCRANLVPQPSDSVREVPILGADEQPAEDIEAQNDAVHETVDAVHDSAEPDVNCSNQPRRRVPRSHSTGHSVVQPGENTERFTLRLPVEVREQLLHRARGLVSRTGGEGSGRGKSLRRLDRGFKSDKWDFTMVQRFLVRASPIRSPRLGNSAGEGTSTSTLPPPAAARPPV